MPASGLPAGLIKCAKCNTFFKSRKGYIGHCVTRHGSVEAAERDDDELQVIKTEVESDEENFDVDGEAADNSDISSSSPVQRGKVKTRSVKDDVKEDYMKQREREDKLVADIIAKVKRECEAQSITMCRKGYSRRSTVMTSFKDYGKRK